MPKAFEYKDAKDQINYFKQLLNNLNKGVAFQTSCQKDLEQQISILYSSGFFSAKVEKELVDEKIDLDDRGTSLFLSKIFYAKESSRHSNNCELLLKGHKTTIEGLISSLSSGSNALFWLFSSKKRKADAEEAYERLIAYRDSLFTTSANEELDSLNGIKKTSYEVVKEDYKRNFKEYKDCLGKLGKRVFESNGLVEPIQKHLKEYFTIQETLNEIRESVNDSSREIKAAIDRLLAEELVEALRKISVDELAREKSGIKIKCLKDAGYDTLADVFAASTMQIASVYGISQDKAYTIKSKCDNYAKQIRRGMKIKLSTDNKTKASAGVVRAIYTYIKKKEYIKQIDELDRECGHDIRNALDELGNIGNGVVWLFLTEEERVAARKAFHYVESSLTSQYVPLASDIYKQFNSRKSVANNAWKHFSENSIGYYNVIEEVYPGVLGTDDSIYGLPEELARQIQDECFFPEGLLCTLRRYQEWGVKYILHQEKALLGDEMGLGKTIQAIATMVSLKNTGASHFLVVCPASVVTNWCREIVKHSRLRVTKIHGVGKASAFKSWIKTGGVAVTNFESTAQIKLEENYKFSLLVVDEAHYIKNIKARRSINTRLLAEHAERLLFMTGTALENNVDEMISLIDVLRPSIAQQVRNLAFMSSAPQFREKIAPVYYRRKREDVLTELPDKIESKEWCTLNDEEMKVYEDAILEKRYQDARRLSWNIDDLTKSSKAQRLKEIVEQAESEGRKVLVFSFFLDTIAKIHSFLRGKCLNPITGSVNVNRRQEIIDEFDQAPAGTVLLAQINSGGTGLNIQSASVVVICEPQFKPSIENQAISRAYRMGQSRNVLVYRLLCEDTIDEKLMDVLEEKQRTFDAFADKSVAAQHTVEVDERTFGQIIQEEIVRINAKRGLTTKPTQGEIDVQEEPRIMSGETCLSKAQLVDDKYYETLLGMNYDELVEYLLNKHGRAKYDYFTSASCATKNRKVSRTKEGLVCHHIDEDKAIMLSEPEHACKNPYEYQKAERLVYCNLLEHLLLHVLIMEKAKDPSANKNEIQGVGGAVTYICAQLNDFYSGYSFKKQWLIDVTSPVRDDYESYIRILQKLWNNIRQDHLLATYIQKKDLARGWDGSLYTSILNDIEN